MAVTTTCERCGHAIRLGEHPFCPHGFGGQHARVTNESFIGGQIIENLDHDPVTVYSREELQREMDKRGLEQRIKYVPGDKVLTNWAMSIDPQTLENVRILLSRVSVKTPRPVTTLDSFRPIDRVIES